MRAVKKRKREPERELKELRKKEGNSKGMSREKIENTLHCSQKIFRDAKKIEERKEGRKRKQIIKRN